MINPLISAITLEGRNGTKKHISFEKDGIWNYPQLNYFNALFNPDLTLKTDYNEAAYFGAFRCAKSFSQQLAVFLINSKYTKVRSVYVRDTYDELETSVIEQFRQDFEYLGAFEYLKSDRVATFKDTGSKLYFRAFNYDTDILSSERDLIAACQTEDIPEELFLQFFGRLSGSSLPSPLLLTEGNPASNYVKKRYKDHTEQDLRAKKIFFVQGRTDDNPHISKAYIERVRENYPAFWVARYLDGEWSNLDEMVFSEFRESRDLINPIDSNNGFKKRAGLDYGWINPSALVWGQVDYDGNVTIYDEWKAAKQSPAEIKTQSMRYGKMRIIADYSIKKADRDGRSLWQDLEDAGLNLVESNKQELENIVLINTLLKQGRLKITRNCTELIKEILNYKWKKIKLGEEKNHSEQTVDKDNHLCFGGDTGVYCKGGIKKIKDIKLGDYVRTPLGYNKVLQINSHYADTLLYTFDNNNAIISTAEHPFFHNGGLIPISKCGGDLWKFSGQESIIFLITKSIVGMVCIGRRLVDVLKDAKGYIKQYGNMLTGKLSKGLKYIILTLTNRTMKSAILNYSQMQNIEVCMDSNIPMRIKKSNEPISTKLEGSQKLGIEALKVDDGIVSMENSAGLTREHIYTSAWLAGKHFTRELKERNYVRKTVCKWLDEVLKKILLLENVLIVGKILKLINIRLPKTVQKVAHKDLGRGQVYNLLVDKCGLYFANGFLVSNCDAMLYMIADIEELKTVRPEVELFNKSILYKTIQRNEVIDIGNIS